MILENLRLALASTFKFALMSGALAPGKHVTMVAGVSIFTFRVIESPITREQSFSVGVSLSGANRFVMVIGTEEWFFDPPLERSLTVTHLPGCIGSTSARTDSCKEFTMLGASKVVFKSLALLLSSIKVWMRVSNSEIFSVSLTVSLHLSHINPILPTEKAMLNM
ncbi:hypothetical protein PO909_017003 [Leuciscus waleckii]